MSNEYLSSSGTGSTVQSQRGNSAEPVLNSSAPGVQLNALYVGNEPSGSPNLQAIIREAAKPTHKRSQSTETKSKRVRPEERDALRRYWTEAKGKAETMEEAKQSQDVVMLASATFDLDALLDEMWLLRHVREDDWRGVLNFLQGVFKKVEVNTLTLDQCTAIKNVISGFLGPATVDKDDVRDARKTLRRGGFDPWRPISGDPEVQA